MTAAPPRDDAPILATGALKREREMVLSFRIPGVITRLGVDDGDAVPVIGRLRGALLPRRPRADHDEVERVGLRDRAQVDLARHVDVGVRQIGAQVELHADPLPRRHPRCPARRLAPERSRRTRADA